MRFLRSIKDRWRAASAVFVFHLAWLASSSVHGAGVAAFKEQPFHSDDLATMIVYAKMHEAGLSSHFDLGGKELVVDRSKIVAHVTVPELPANLRDANSKAQLRQTFAELSAFAARFKKAVPILQPHAEQLKKAIARREAGDVRYDGQWISGDMYAGILQKEADARAAAAKEEMERAEAMRIAREKERAFAAAQRAKGLEIYGGQWLPRREAEMLWAASAEVEAKSILAMQYTVFQVLDEGMLVEPYDGYVKRGGLNVDLVYLYGAPKGTIAAGDAYKDTVYWCGTYSYQTKGGRDATVHAYCFDRSMAINIVKVSLFPDEHPQDQRPEKVKNPLRAPDEDEDLPPLLRAYNGFGSGFFIGEEGYFVTNQHVVGDASAVDIYHEDKKVPARVLHVSKAADLAVLKADIAVSGLVLAEEEAEPGNDIYVVGFPQPTIQGIDVKVTKGIVSSKRDGRNESRFQIDAAIQPGNSGGALCDELGRVRGVVVAMLSVEYALQRTGNLPQNVNYAIKASELAAFLRSKSVKFQQANATEAQGPRGVGVKMVCAASGLVLVKK